MKHLLTLVTAATLSSTLVQADSNGRMNKRNHSAQSEKPARPVDDKYGPFLRQGFFLTADFLYWIAHEEGLEYATTGVIGTAQTSSVAQGSAQKLNFKWKPGFRVGLGWTLPNSYWDLSANWTWYHSTAKGSATSSTTTVNSLWPSLLAPVLSTEQGALSSASANWRLCYNTIDFELGRSFYPNKHLAVRPHSGVRAAWINQRYSNVYNFAPAAASTVTRSLRNNYQAAGFKVGVDSLWSCNRYWGIFANSSMSLLGGNFSVRETDFASVPLSGIAENAISVRDKLFSVVPVFETAMGFHLTLAPNNRHYWFDLNAGWEYLVWFDQNQMALFTDSTANGTFIRERANLHLMGFTLNAKLHF